MPIKGSVLLSPVNSYSLYGKFPLAFWVHILIVIFDSGLLVRYNTTIGKFARTQELLWYKIFLNSDFDAENYGLERR